MTDPYHTGELTVQQLAGVSIMAEQNGRSIRNSIPKGAVPFLTSQTLAVVASHDEQKRTWCSFLTGAPGFITVEDEVTLHLETLPVEGDPLANNLSMNRDVGLLVIDLSKRIRLRLNGTGYIDDNQRLKVLTEQVYGNCPKYIQKRVILPTAVSHRKTRTIIRMNHLSARAREWICMADTFFIASSSLEGKVDASHRGGSPGFVHIVDDRTLIFPDYFGNSMFNTLGNIYSNPHTGLLFIDFNFGHSFQLTGRSTIIWDEEQINLYPSAERIIRFELDEALITENSTALSWEFMEFSPANPSLENLKGR